MNDFFSHFDKKKPELEPAAELKIKTYPAWVDQSKKPEKIRHMYDVVIDMFDLAATKIRNKTFTTASEVILSQAKICRAIPLKGRSGLKNHKKIVDLMDEKNIILERRIADIKEKAKKSTVRKTKAMINSELEEYKGEYAAKTQLELDRLINSELLVSQSDAMSIIADLKQTIKELRQELAELKSANAGLQNDNRNLQRRIFLNSPSKI